MSPLGNGPATASSPQNEPYPLKGPVGEIACYRAEPADGSATRTVVLLHSVNAAASAHEMQPIFDALCTRYRVLAFDLPGFGRSDRPAVRYDIPLFTDAIDTMLDHAAEVADGLPLHAVGLSLTSEFLARAFLRAPERVRSLTFVTPTGFSKGSGRYTRAGGNREVPGFTWIFDRRPWSRPLFDLLTTKRSVRYFLRRTFGGDSVPDWLVEASWKTARPAGAEHAPFAFLSGRLFAADVRSLYDRIRLPVWVPHGTRGDFADFSETGWAEQAGNWRFEPYDAGALPHVEHPERFIAALTEFLERT